MKVILELDVSKEDILELITKNLKTDKQLNVDIEKIIENTSKALEDLHVEPTDLPDIQYDVHLKNEDCTEEDKNYADPIKNALKEMRKTLDTLKKAQTLQNSTADIFLEGIDTPWK